MARDALDDLIATAQYIARDDRNAARAVAAAIRLSGNKLGDLATGRPGRVSGTYEKSVARLPYVIAYAIRSRPDGSEEIAILRVIHTSREWLPGRWPD